MATIKSFTDLQQSKKLEKILPLESADMRYDEYTYHIDGIPKVGYKEGITDGIPCWSLATLLSVLPKRIKECNVLRIDIDEKDFAIWYDEVGFGVNNDLPDITADNPVDACYEMIIRLHKSNLL
jgi:hypothetical protein